MKSFLLTVAVTLIASSHIVHAIEPPATERSDKALLIRTAPSTDGPQVQIEVADRAQINKDMFVRQNKAKSSA